MTARCTCSQEPLVSSHDPSRSTSLPVVSATVHHQRVPSHQYQHHWRRQNSCPAATASAGDASPSPTVSSARVAGTGDGTSGALPQDGPSNWGLSSQPGRDKPTSKPRIHSDLLPHTQAQPSVAESHPLSNPQIQLHANPPSSSPSPSQ